MINTGTEYTLCGLRNINDCRHINEGDNTDPTICGVLGKVCNSVQWSEEGASGTGEWIKAQEQWQILQRGDQPKGGRIGSGQG